MAITKLSHVKERKSGNPEILTQDSIIALIIF